MATLTKPLSRISYLNLLSLLFYLSYLLSLDLASTTSIEESIYSAKPIESLASLDSFESFEYLPEPERIVGIRNDSRFVIPFMAGIELWTVWPTGEFHWEFICGASIISNRWLITAAHCFDPDSNISNYRMFYSTIDLFEKNVTVGVEELFLNGRYGNGYGQETSGNDIALIRTNISIPLGRIAAQAILLNRDQTLNTAQSVTLYGFGFGSNGTLKEAIIDIYDQWNCGRQWRVHASRKYRLANESEFCTRSDQSDAGKGDSGGPVVFDAGKRKFYLAGIVSRGSKQSDPDATDPLEIPGIHTDVRAHFRWIINVINETETDVDDYLFSRIRNNRLGVKFDDPKDDRVYRGPMPADYNTLYTWTNILWWIAYVAGFLALTFGVIYGIDLAVKFVF